MLHLHAQVLLLLKSSDRVSHDLELLQQMAACHQTLSADTRQSAEHVPSAAASPAAASAPRAQLVLRRWQDLRPEREFRCFVHNHALVAISQRDPSQYFPQLAGEAASIRAVICTFHEEHVGSRFALPSCKCTFSLQLLPVVHDPTLWSTVWVCGDSN